MSEILHNLEREITMYLAEQRRGPEAWRAAWLDAIDRVFAEPLEKATKQERAK